MQTTAPPGRRAGVRIVSAGSGYLYAPGAGSSASPRPRRPAVKRPKHWQGERRPGGPLADAPSPSTEPAAWPPAGRALAWMVLAQALFAGMNVCTRLGARTLPWSEIAATRFLIGALIAVGLAAARGSSLRVTDRRNTWLRSVFGTTAALGSFYAFGSTGIAVGDVATLGATAPVFVALLSAPLLGERVEGPVALAVALAFAGVVAVVGPTFEVAWPVAAVATASGFFYALAMIWLRKIGPGETHEAVVLHFSLVASAATLALAVPVWRRPEGAEWLVLLAAGLGGGGAQLAMTRAYALHRAAPVTTLTYLGIVFTHLLAAAAFAEWPTAWQLAGSVLVIAAGVLVTVGARRVSARSDRTVIFRR
jgi:drug/metabolite transporter (DMT)-like permease